MRSNVTGAAGKSRYTLLAGVTAFALATPGVALAQDTEADEEDIGLEAPESGNQIIVTASKREQTLQETPISVSVTSGETLENAQIRDVLDLQTVTPSLRVSQLQSASASTFIIRGFGNGDNNFGIEPSVGVFIDGVFRSRSASALSDLPNVERIEVLRGPQSTLFGKNASAGVISVVTREPQFDFGGTLEASYGNYNALILRGDITGPLTDTLAFSVDGSYNRRDGFAEIVNLDEDINNRNRWSARGQLLFEPTPDLSFRAIADYSKIDEVCCQVGTVVEGPTGAAVRATGGELDTDFFAYESFLNQEPLSQVDNYGVSLQADYESGAFSFTSITSYRELENILDQDVDFTSADVVSERRDQKVSTFTQELRIATNFDGPINFLLGGFFFDETVEQVSGLDAGSDARLFFDLLAGGPGVFDSVEPALGIPVGGSFAEGPFTRDEFGMDNQAWSIFGTVDFEPVDGLVFTAGFNYTDDKKDYTLQREALDPLSNVNLVDQFIVVATGGTVTTRDQFQALPQGQQDALAGLALTPCPPGTTDNCNPFLGLSALQFQPPWPNVPNEVEDGQTRDDDWSYTLRLAYDVAPELNVYLSYATGFKASSVNLSADSRPTALEFTPGPVPDGIGSTVGGSNFLAPDSPIVDAGIDVTNLTTGSRVAGPEKAKVWEVGMKGQFEGVGFNLALFDQTLEGFQSFIFTGTGFQLNNAGEQSVRGFEFDTNITPADGLVLTFATTYLDAVFDDFVDSPVGDLSGERPGGIPEWTIATSATYTHEFGASGNRLVTRVDYSHESNTPINNGLPTYNASLGNSEIFFREINLVNASSTVMLDNGLEVGIWARNLFNDQYIMTVFDGVAQAGTVSGYPSPPRTYGGIVRFRF
ncbi:MAG: TonB-dependent receptor [Erythrobacter sp.]|uniref:TonB-dependent receptor n=1 Tax=Erythrobacter sp. TaxID=1042 RepID=UPI00261A1F10|nr:TonB-dependent receptor [Erythrobacter sp.]MDJ0978744.1 TonB-dependent receptor [Erythrobacter sp.]